MPLREDTQEENFPDLPEGSRAPQYDHLYKGGFQDRSQHIRPVMNMNFLFHFKT